MKRTIFGLLAFFAVEIVCAQAKLPTVAVNTFDTVGSVSSDEAAVVTELFMSLIVEGKKVNVVDRNSFDKIVQQMNFQITDWSDNDKVAQLGQALNAEYIIRGQIMKMGNAMYLSATMLDVNTTAIIASAREQLGGFDELFATLPKLSRQILNGLPEPNYLVGKWRTSNSKCILEFKADRTIIVERYDYEYDLRNDRGQGAVGKGTASGEGFYSTDSPASGGYITINLHLTGPADITNFGQDVSFEKIENYSWFTWRDSSKNSFGLYYAYRSNSTGHMTASSNTALPIKRYRDGYSRGYNEFFRIQ
jgi:TolB-like protein